MVTDQNGDQNKEMFGQVGQHESGQKLTQSLKPLFLPKITNVILGDNRVQETLKITLKTNQMKMSTSTASVIATQMKKNVKLNAIDALLLLLLIEMVKDINFSSKWKLSFKNTTNKFFCTHFSIYRT